MASLLKRDPSRTLMLRGKYEKLLRSKFLQVKNLLRSSPSFQAVLTVGIPSSWSFSNPADRVGEVQRWLRSFLSNFVLGDTWEAMTQEAFYKGLSRAYDDAKKAGKVTEQEEVFQTRKEGFLRGVLSSRDTSGLVQMLSSQCREEASGMVDRLVTYANRIVSLGFLKESTAQQITTQLLKELDKGLTSSYRILRTELIRAHSEGQLAVMEHLGTTQVTAEVEWISSEEACPQCKGMNRRIFSIEEAHGLLPLHPGCSCSWIPA